MKGFIKLKENKLRFCYVCNKSFATNSSLKRHKQTHESEFYCPICLYRTIHWNNLECHLNLHLKVASLIKQQS